MISRIFCTVFSILAGILGFAWAVTAEPEIIHLFIKASFVVLLIQIPFMAVASKNKNRLAKSKVGASLHLRSEFAANFNFLLAIIVGICGIFLAEGTELEKLAWFSSIILLTHGFQLKSFYHSSRFQITDLDFFWKTQLTGAALRFGSVILFVQIINIGFWGILFSNLVASIVIAFIYKALIFKIKLMKQSFIVAFKNSNKLLSIDGILRAMRNFYEQLSVSFIAICLEYTLSFDAKTIEHMYASIGYINAGTTALRQIFASLELSSFKRQPIFKKTAIIYLLSIPAAIISFYIYQYTDFKYLILPSIGDDGMNYIVIAIYITFYAYPFTLGFAFMDYLPAKELLNGMLVMALLLLLFTIICVALYKFGVASYVPIWAMIVPMSIGLSRYFWKVKYAR